MAGAVELAQEYRPRGLRIGSPIDRLAEHDQRIRPERAVDGRQLHPHVRIGELGAIGFLGAMAGEEGFEVFRPIERSERGDERLSSKRGECGRILVGRRT